MSYQPDPEAIAKALIQNAVEFINDMRLDSAEEFLAVDREFIKELAMNTFMETLAEDVRYAMDCVLEKAMIVDEVKVKYRE